MAESVKEDLIKFIADLKNENAGITWAEVADGAQK